MTYIIGINIRAGQGPENSPDTLDGPCYGPSVDYWLSGWAQHLIYLLFGKEGWKFSYFHRALL